MLGPTRPSSKEDPVGNPLDITRSHPYFASEKESAVLNLNFTLRVWMPEYDASSHIFGSGHNYEKLYVEDTLKVFTESFLSDDVEVLSHTQPLEWSTADVHQGSWYSDMLIGLEVVADGLNNPESLERYNYTSVGLLFDEITAGLESFVNGGELTTGVIWRARKTAALKRSLTSATISFPPTHSTPLSSDTPTPYNAYMRLLTPNPNPYAEFCSLGCTFFFSFGDQTIEAETSGVLKPVYLSNCTDLCDDYFAYNITVAYSDLVESARLECRDGCQIALKRCAPGYKCEQVKEIPGSGGKFTDGNMEYCPPGSYRDVDYDSVEECVDCPPGRYRESFKGRYMESCSKCPEGTFVNSTGSSSILQCSRCPAGRFGPEPGLALCKCITKSSCLDGKYTTVDGDVSFEEFVDPADAEKRDTFPFIGRW